MSELLVEILSEEIPSRFHNNVLGQCRLIIEREIAKHAIVAKGLEIYVSPRRLVFKVEEVSLGVVEPKRGPKIDANDKAIEGFAKSCGFSVSQLHKKDIDGVEYYFSPADSGVMDIREVLCKVIDRSLSQISWPKSMYWNSNKVRWVRPIRNIMAIFNGDILSFEFCGFKANSDSYGHKLMNPGKFTVKSFKQYKAELLSRNVILSSETRKQNILDQTSLIVQNLGVEIIYDEALFSDIVGLVEYPVVRYGSIDQKFLSLPKEVIVKIMSSHQKFIATQYADGNLAPYFIVVLNVDFTDSEQDIIAGNEKVLSARLYDGKFFFEEDTNRTLESRVDDLKQVVFHDRLGTLFDKVKRIEKISLFFASVVEVDKSILSRAALLSKADLTTLMVNEFPELQGIIGRYYAQHEGENDNVVKTVYEHYLPSGRDSECPSSIYGAVVSVADKIDTIVGLFLANEIPTSSKDPYALRRCALGVIRIICEFSLDINVKDIIKYSISLYDLKYDDHLLVQILDFIYERFRYWLKLSSKDGFVSAALYKKSGSLSQEYKVLKFLENMLRENKDLFFTFKRVVNVVKSSKVDSLAVDKQLLTEIEAKLIKQIESLDSAIRDFYSTKGSDSLVSIFKDIEETVSILFKDTMIMDKNLEIQKHRISVLNQLYSSFIKIADFSLIDL